MATTAAEILARLEAIGYGTDTEAAQLIMLNSAHKRVCNTRRWDFLFSTDSSKSLTTGTGTLAYNTLANRVSIDAVRLELNGKGYEPGYVPVQQMREIEVQEPEVRGRPEFWSREGGELHFWPIPDQNYKVLVDFITAPANITSGATAVQIPDAQADILIWAIAMQITFRERDWDAHNMARQMYSELLTELLGQHGMKQRQSSTRVKESGFSEPYEFDDSWLN